MQEGWPLDAVCDHLEAVTFGNILKLLMNVPPGFMKSLMTDVFWPAWEWGPMNMPHLRYVTFSYSASLTERDNERFSKLVMSPEYQEMWGTRFRITKTGVGKISNDKTGWKLASSVGGVGTGERGDRILCFPAETLVDTERGRIAIGDIVRRRLEVRVWSYSSHNGLQLKPITGWHRNPGRRLLRITLEDGSSLVCTVDHRVLTPGGYEQAQSLRIGDTLCTAPCRVHVAAPDIAWAQGQLQVPPSASGSDACDCLGTDAVLQSKNLRSVVMPFGDLTHDLFSQVRRTIAEGAVALGVGDVLRASAVLQVDQSRVGAVTVLVPDLLPIRTRPDEGCRNHLVDEAINGVSRKPHGDARIALVEDGCQQAARHAHGGWQAGMSTWPDDGTFDAGDAPEIADGVGALKAGDVAPALARVAYLEEVIPHSDETFCLTVSDNHNMLCGDGAQSIICANCDDPHNVKEVESDTVRQETVRWFRESMSNRLNNENSAIVVIMQRLHEADVSGTILSEGFDYCHLMIPMEYDPDRYPEEYNGTDIGWIDPREETGELAWPERFSENQIDTFKRELGPFAWAGQYQQSPVPRGGGIFKRDWWQVWEPTDGKWPKFEYLIAYLDSAYTKKEENNPSALSVWGVFTNETGLPCVMLVKAWRKHLEMHGVIIEKGKDETVRSWLKKSQPHWGLVEYVAEACRFRNSDGVVIGTVDRLIIEAKASGISVAQEIQRLYGNEGWITELDDPHGDKVARAHSVVPIFANAQVYAPDREWADVVIDEMATFPHGRYDDLTDTATGALRHLRAGGMLQQRSEIAADDERKGRLRGKKRALYQV